MPGRRRSRVPSNVGTMDDVYGAMSEGELQAHVVRGLEARGWLTWHIVDSRLVAAGLPDTLALHADYPVLLCWEHKRANTHPTARQADVLWLLEHVAGVDARVVRPRDLGPLLAAIDSADPIAALSAIEKGV